jgi:competence protein ComEA
MRVCERQDLGSLTFLVAALTVYGVSLFHQYVSYPQFYLPWGDRMAGTMAVEVSGSQSSDGIYFLPKDVSLKTIKSVIGINDTFIRTSPDGLPFNDRPAVAILMEGGVPKVGDMRASTRLALGIPVNLNVASAEELALIPGIGESLAARIFQFRFLRGKIESISELTAIPGIKEKKLDSLKQYLSVQTNQ